MKMHNNTIWLAFLVLCGTVVLWFSGVALYKFYNFSRLQAETVAKTVSWSIKEVSEEKFVIEATYTYLVNNKEYTAETAFWDDYHLNSWSAERSVKFLSSQPIKVWYSPSNPQISSLQKKFPYRELISSGLLWGLFLYFIWLGFYVVRYRL